MGQHDLQLVEARFKTRPGYPGIRAGDISISAEPHMPQSTLHDVAALGALLSKRNLDIAGTG